MAARKAPPAPAALVTGGSRGIGRAVAEQLAGAGWQVWTVSRTAPAAPHANEHHVAADLADEAQIAALFAQLAARNIALQGLVNNAAVQGGKPAAEQTAAEWRRMLDVNVTAPWLMIKGALPLLRDGAAIVNVGSVAAVAGFADRAAYCASKHALLGLTRALACELAPRGIRVNHLCLGTFATPGLEALAAAHGRPTAAYADRQLLARLGDPAEAAAACAFLLSAQASFVTGSSLTVDGGLLAKGRAG